MKAKWMIKALSKLRKKESRPRCVNCAYLVYTESHGWRKTFTQRTCTHEDLDGRCIDIPWYIRGCEAFVKKPEPGDYISE